MIVILATLAAVVTAQMDGVTTGPEEAWTGRWMPHAPFTEGDRQTEVDLHDSQHGVRMGVIKHSCDDAQTNLTLDWDMSPYEYTCFNTNGNKYVPKVNIKPILECEHIPKLYVAHHECMNNTIEYATAIPTFGTHRPLWPRYGEYKYVPRQRWLHNLEHGGIVMLYHPCTSPVEVNRLRHLVTGCLRRHVITPSPLLDPERPLALVSWGCRLTMSTVNKHIVVDFIKQHALRGPEKLSKDGQYTLALISPAQIVSDVDDSMLCPRL